MKSKSSLILYCSYILDCLGCKMSWSMAWIQKTKSDTNVRLFKVLHIKTRILIGLI